MSVDYAICQIEHHATLFALLSKYAFLYSDNKGKDAIINAVQRYGKERGKRMARRAIKNNDSLSLVNSIAYGEWRPIPGQMENSVLQSIPTYVTSATKCAWCEAWKKHGLLEFGKLYCVNIDDAVFSGFNSKYSVKVNARLSWGQSRCEFDWQLPMEDDDFVLLDKKREVLGNTCVRDFNFHTAHLFSTISDELVRTLGDLGLKAVEAAKAEYIEKFGVDYFYAFYSILNSEIKEDMYE